MEINNIPAPQPMESTLQKLSRHLQIISTVLPAQQVTRASIVLKGVTDGVPFTEIITFDNQGEPIPVDLIKNFFLAYGDRCQLTIKTIAQ